MITFKRFLNEAKHRQDISIERAKQLIAANCKDADLKLPLWRGFSGKEDAYLVQGELGERTSANTTNHYTVIMDHFLAPLGYPKRSASIILANNTNMNSADKYGNLYAIFPFDGVKIGVCEDADIWYTKISIGPSRPQKIDKWNEFFEDAKIPDFSFEDLVQGITETLQNKDDEYHDLMKNLFGENDVERVLQEAFSPKSLGTHLATTADISKYNDRPRELWIGGKCVALSEETWKSMLEDKE